MTGPRPAPGASRKSAAPTNVPSTARRMRRALLALAGGLLAWALTPALAEDACPPVKEMIEGADRVPAMQETPFLAAKVKAGDLPPVSQRIPRQPLVIDRFAGSDGPGRSGGDLVTLMAIPREVRMMVVYGYARLVGFDDRRQMVADLLQDVDVEDGRIFTLKLRAGHKWSDGKPFTTEDFRYFWEDVANNAELTPSGPPLEMLVDGKPPKVEIIDETTIRYSWDKPNPYFLPAQARPSPLFIYRPAHYLKQFHHKYADAAELKKKIEYTRQRTWASLHNRMDDMYRNENPDLPSLHPWILESRPPYQQRIVFVRNPYYHRVDGKGVQLPYVDRVIMNLVTSSLIPLKAGSAEADLQARYLRFDNYTFLRQGAKQFGFDVRLWDTGLGAHLALYPNLNYAEPVWQAVLREPNVRRALSMGIDRDEINEILYIGLASPSNNTVRPASPLYREDYATKYARFDAKEANRVLDKVVFTMPDGKKGDLRKRNNRGVRLLPDGRPMVIVLETAGESTEETDVLRLIADSWKKIGVELVTRPQTREILRGRIYSGEAMMTIWGGMENGVPDARSSPAELACLSQSVLWCPKFGQYRETGGKSGEPIPDSLAVVHELSELAERWGQTADCREQERIWHRMLQIHADFQYTIGIVAGVKQPVVVSKALRNVPRTGVYSWEPYAFFGAYRPDTFWLEGKK
ncbi:MAG: ABC transporter substrate-binding protein [Alphaproteobacteria bacterium]|nr:ABC transporter substrate-binding protein [Alphaproteobacteria bacterium]